MFIFSQMIVPYNTILCYTKKRRWQLWQDLRNILLNSVMRNGHAEARVIQMACVPVSEG